MTPEALFTQALGLGDKWLVTKCSFEGEPKVLELKLAHVRGAKFCCPEEGCVHQTCPVHDTQERRWRHLNFFQYECHLSAKVPRVKCSDHGVKQVPVPWARPGSGFTLWFEALVLTLGRQMQVAAVGRELGEHDTRMWRVITKYVEAAQAERDWSGVRRVQVDETSSRRGHRYVTNFLDADSRDLLMMSQGRSAEVLGELAAELPAHGARPEQIEWISMDMSPAFEKGAREHFPQAQIAYDKFHIMQLAGRAVDEVRRDLQRGGSAPELKGQRWTVLGNPWRLSSERQARRRELCGLYPKLGRALGLRDTLQDALNMKDPGLLTWFLGWAARSRLAPFKKLARTIKAHLPGILGYFQSGLTNAAIEAVNGKLQLAKRLARGYRSFKNFRAMAYLQAAQLQLPSIQSLQRAHPH